MTNTIWFHLFQVLRVVKSIATERKMSRGGEREELKVIVNAYSVSIADWKKSSGGCTAVECI